MLSFHTESNSSKDSEMKFPSNCPQTEIPAMSGNRVILLRKQTTFQFKRIRVSNSEHNANILVFVPKI